jgi:hypothetical protein
LKGVKDGAPRINPKINKHSADVHRLERRDLPIAPALTKLVMIVMPAIAISIVVMIPAVVVLESPSVAVPIAGVVAFAVMVGLNPARALIRRASPIAGVPSVMPTRRIPVAIDPYKIRSGASWNYGHHAGRRWRADLNAK